MLRRLRKLTGLSRLELAELLSAQCALIQAQLLRWTRPEGRLVAPAPGPASVTREDDSTSTALRLALAVSRAAENGIFRPTCLVRAIALTRMLEARGIYGSQLRVGARRDGERFTAHAWVEYQGRPLGDGEEHVKTFTLLSDLRVLPPR